MHFSFFFRHFEFPCPGPRLFGIIVLYKLGRRFKLHYLLSPSFYTRYSMQVCCLNQGCMRADETPQEGHINKGKTRQCLPFVPMLHLATGMYAFGLLNYLSVLHSHFSRELKCSNYYPMNQMCNSLPKQV